MIMASKLLTISAASENTRHDLCGDAVASNRFSRAPTSLACSGWCRQELYNLIGRSASLDNQSLLKRSM